MYFQGNVALDVARILLRPTAELAKTDIASHALSALEESTVRFVVSKFLFPFEKRLFGVEFVHVSLVQESLFGRKTWTCASSMYCKRAS